MFIICPKCGAKYKIPAETVLDAGQKLKCSACDFIFEKGQEAPLTLTPTEPEQQTPPAAQMQPFAKPIYHESDLNISPNDSVSALPEAFQPIPSPAGNRKSFWIILPLYLIIIAVLCVAGWSFREMLKPSFSGYLPIPTTQPADKKATSPVDKKLLPPAVKPVDQQPVTTPLPVVEQPTPKAEPVVKQVIEQPAPAAKPAVKKITPVTVAPVIKPEPAAPIKPIVEVQPKPIIETKPMVKAEPKPMPKVEEPILAQTDTFTISEQSANTPTNDGKLTEIISSDLTETAEIPLFEVVDEKPTAESPLAVQKLSHQTNQNAEGIPQLLIDGVLKNTGKTPLPAPSMTAFVFDKDGHVLSQKQIFVSESEINPDQEIPFYTGIVPAPENTDHIDIKF